MVIFFGTSSRGLVMTRMSREFSLVLLGAGVLTAGYFTWPEENLEERANEQAQRQVGSRGRVMPLIFFGRFGGGSYANSGKSPAMAGVSRGGFGSIGSRFSGSGS